MPKQPQVTSLLHHPQIKHLTNTLQIFHQFLFLSPDQNSTCIFRIIEEMEDTAHGRYQNANESLFDSSMSQPEHHLTASMIHPKLPPFKPSLHLSSLTLPIKKIIHKPSHLLQASILDIKRAELVRQLCVIAIFNFVSKKITNNAKKTQRESEIKNIKKSFSVSNLLKELSTSPLEGNILICPSKLRARNQSKEERRWIINIASIIHKNRKRYLVERKAKAMQQFEIVLNSKVEDLKMDMKSFNIDDVQYSLDPISLLNTNTSPKEREDRKAQLFNIVNKDIMQMTSRNPGHQYTVIEQIVHIIKNKIFSVKSEMIELEKNIGQLSYRDFKEFYEQIKKINLFMSEVLSILYKCLSVEQNKTTHDFGDTCSRKGFAMKKSNESYYQIVTLSLKNIIQNFNELHSNLSSISNKYFTKSKSKKMNSENLKKFLYSASKLRYHLIYLNKEIAFLKSKLPAEPREQSLEKETPGYRSMRKVLYDKYFFNRNDSDSTQKEFKNAQRILFSNQKHKIGDNRLQIKRKLYNAPCSNRVLRVLKQHRSIHTQHQYLS